MKLYEHASSGNCLKCRIVLRQLELPYDSVSVDLFLGETRTAEHFGRNPDGRIPVLETDEGELIPESGAILLHLAEGTDYLSDDPAERAQTLRWLFWEQSEVIPALAGLRFRLMTGRLAPDAPGAERRRAGGHSVLGVLGSHLDRRQFMVGERYSVADTSLYAYVSVAHEAGFDLRQHTTIGEWLERVEGTPGFMNDFEPYPPNSQVGQSRSIYD